MWYVNGHVHIRGSTRAGPGEKGAGGRQPAREKGEICSYNSIRSRIKFRSQPRRPRWQRPKPTWQPPSLWCGLEAQGSSLRWKLQHAMEDVNNQIALLSAGVATLEAKKASLSRARADFRRAEELLPAKAISQQDYDKFREELLVGESQVKEALETVYQTRVSLGLPAQPPDGHDLTWAPPDLDQTFSSVRQAQADLIQVGAQLGVDVSFAVTPRQMLEEFEKRRRAGTSIACSSNWPAERPP